jgi:hypothetical protein
MRRLLVLLLAVSLAGCLSAPTPSSMTPISADKARELAGTWQGWLVTERSFGLFTFEIKPDGTFEVTGPWTRAQGILVVADGTLRFDGTGSWRGTLAEQDGGRDRSLKLERDDRLVRGSLHRVVSDG